MYSTEPPPEIFYSEPMVDRKSKFQAYCARCKDTQEVCLFRDTLLDNPKIEKATHNILAWITPNDSGYDDDGETHAGIQVLQAMEGAGCENCAVMVSRWFGGIMLHGDRFRDITNIAMTVLRDNGLVPEAPVKKANDKAEKDAEKKRLQEAQEQSRQKRKKKK